MAKVFRLKRTGESELATSGLLLDEKSAVLCATLEPNTKGDHPRIPPGEYDLKLLGPGQSRFDISYREIFGKDFRGLIEIVVPSRSHILFHMGNWFDQTRGCVMCGLTTRKTESGRSFEIPPGESKAGYWHAYQEMMAAVQEGGAKLRVYDPS